MTKNDFEAQSDTKVILPKTKYPGINKTLNDVEETLNDINDKLSELKGLSKGSKVFVVVGWLLMSLAGAALLIVGILGSNNAELFFSHLILNFVIGASCVALLMVGYSIAHKGLTGDWL